jgi:hypothetical protein
MASKLLLSILESTRVGTARQQKGAYRTTAMSAVESFVAEATGFGNEQSAHSLSYAI